MPGKEDMEVRENAVVSFSVKEILAEQTTLLRTIDSKVDGKADKTDLIPIVAVQEKHAARLGKIEQERRDEKTLKDRQAKSRNKVWLFTTAIVVPLAVAAILVLVH